MLTRKGEDVLGRAALLGLSAVATAVATMRIGSRPLRVAPARRPTSRSTSDRLASAHAPCLALGVWVRLRARTTEQRWAFLITLILLIPLGFILDLFFGRTFLRFPNLDATLGILIPGYDLHAAWRGMSGSGWEPALPLEEF